MMDIDEACGLIHTMAIDETYRLIYDGYGRNTTYIRLIQTMNRSEIAYID